MIFLAQVISDVAREVDRQTRGAVIAAFVRRTVVANGNTLLPAPKLSAAMKVAGVVMSLAHSTCQRSKFDCRAAFGKR